MRESEQYDGSGWRLASELIKKYNENPVKCDILLDKLPDDTSSHNRRLCQFLFSSAIRHKKLIDGLIDQFCQKKPRGGLLSFLILGMAEIIEGGEARKVINYVVGEVKKEFSERESRFVNAVMRNANELLGTIVSKELTDDTDWLSLRYSHPEWLVESWRKEFGTKNLLKLLEWDQSMTKLYVRGKDLPLRKTQWKDFYEVAKGDWVLVDGLLKGGAAYIQDPSTRLGPELLEVAPDDRVLDLCAAPGGKARLMGEKLEPAGMLVAVDLPGGRINKLRDNLGKLKELNYTILEKDLIELNPGDFTTRGLPELYDAVFLDAPCSNTGVIGRRPDVKWRLKFGDIARMAKVQLGLLKKASEFVKAGGRIVYSTCSIEREENEEVIEAFLREQGDLFALVSGKRYLPWDTGHDGCGVFLLKRKA